MSRLTIYADDDPASPLSDTRDGAEIAKRLGEIGVRFERWRAEKQFGVETDDAEIFEAYKDDIARIVEEGGYQTVDVLRVTAATPNISAIRAKFLDEHTHSEDEVRFFIEGAGVFYLRTGGKVYMTLCERGDLIGVPAGVTHWFDAGPAPHIAALRFFDKMEGWVPNYTGTDIAARFPKYEGAGAKAGEA